MVERGEPCLPPDSDEEFAVETQMRCVECVFAREME